MSLPKRASQPTAAFPGQATQGAPLRLATRSVSASVSGPSTPVPAAWVSQRPADPAKSLFNICFTVLTRMERIPAIVPYIKACDYTTTDAPLPQINLGVAPHGGHIDPVSQLWRILRLGAPLCALFNALDTPTKLDVMPPGQCVEIRTVKKLLYRFLEACMTELNFRPEEELFTISNVFSDSTSDLLKVIRTVQALLDLIEAKDPVHAGSSVTAALSKVVDLPGAKSQRDNVVLELVNTERKYVQDLELMATYHDALLTANIPRETVQKMFPYLNRLVDFQRRFLVGLEYHARLPPADQQFGSLFALMKDEFQVYEGYTLNQKEASDLALSEAPSLSQFSDILEPIHELQAMLIKPVQRICKYPLLLKQILKNTPEDWAPYPALMNGLDIMQDITQTVNETQRRIENRYVFNDLRERLRDWRGLALERMGDLLLNGSYPVVTGETEVEYHLYLFETILLCCKDGVPAKKGGLKMRSRQSKRFSLDLKGRIYMSYVTSTKVTKEHMGYLLSVVWGRGDASETGSFDIRLGNEEQVGLWESTIQKLITTRVSGSAMPTVYDDDDATGGPFYDDPMTPTSMTSNATSPADARGLRKLSVSSAMSSNHTDGPLSAPPTSGTRLSQATGLSTLRDDSSSSYTQSLGSTAGLIAGRSWSNVGLSNGSTLLSGNHGESTNGHSNGHVNGSDLDYHRGVRHSSGNINGHGLNGLNGGSGINGVSTPTGNGANGSLASSRNPSYFNMQNGLTKMSVADSPDSTSAKLSALPQLRTGQGATSDHLTGPSSAEAHDHATPNQHRVRVHHRVDSFLLLVPKDITYEQLQARVERKIRLCGKIAPSPLRMKYRDEDEDFVTLGSDDDLQMALEERLGQELMLWVS